MPALDALIPAGGRIEGELARQAGTHFKPLIEVRGHPIIKRTILSLREIGVERIVVAASDEVRAAIEGKVTAILPDSGSGPANIRAGLEWFDANPGADRLLVVTADLPAIDAAILRDFLSRCSAKEEISVPVFTKEQFERRFPGITSTYVKLKEGEFTMGGAFLVQRAAASRAMPQFDRIWNQRKSALGMVNLLGPAFLMAFLTQSLTIAQVESKVEKLTGCAGEPVYGAHPELAFDIDDLEDYTYAKGRIL